ncbi:MAG: HPr family phosphocarrier protein [Clostridia bacterium]|nr:HPr family phosphocarrier protein [Clostridia bacterium]
MKNVKIRLSTIADVRDFVNIVNRTDADIDLISGRYIVDAKSIMGIFSLDLMQPIELSAHTEDEAIVAELMENLKPFIVD